MDVGAEVIRVIEALYDSGWSDGLPIAPPTRARVAELVRVTGRDADVVVGEIPPMGGRATIRKLAANAVM
ncbi:MAG: hypothetical protein HY329_24945, partial [Chloroflexi bacterium]|nr:hypothetical protein [Chloroflexota bacterium]